MAEKAKPRKIEIARSESGKDAITARHDESADSTA